MQSDVSDLQSIVGPATAVKKPENMIQRSNTNALISINYDDDFNEAVPVIDFDTSAFPTDKYICEYASTETNYKNTDGYKLNRSN